MRTAIYFLLITILAAAAIAPLPPTFEHQQFHGTVIWDAPLILTPQTIIAKTATKEFRSSIIHQTCTSAATECAGTYGKDTSNLLRVSASAGESISFYVDSKLVLTTPYRPDEITELNLNVSVADKTPPPPPIQNTSSSTSSSNATSGASSEDENTSGSTPPSDAASCVSNWQCGGWSECQSGQQSKTCVDANSCNPTQLTKIEQQACTPAAQQAAIPPAAGQPAAFQPSPPKTDVQEQTTAEEGSEESSLIKIALLIGGIIILLALIGGGTFYIVKLKGASLTPVQEQQLMRYFQSNFARGLNKQQVSETLLRSGWKKGTINKFLKKHKL